MIKKHTLATTLATTFLALSAACVQAQTAAANTPIATVNGSKISSGLLNLLLGNSLQQGAQDTPELRAMIKNELVAKEVLAQEAVRLGLDKLPATQDQLLLMRMGLLADAAIAKNLEKNPITEDMLKAEYKRQTDLLADAEQYLISHIVLATQAEAVEVLKLVRQGQAFDMLARTRSVEASKQNGGSLGWLLPNQLIEPLASVVANMSKGAVSAAPIQTRSGWQIIKLEDKRPFKAPTFEDSKQAAAQAVFMAQRSEYLQKLLKAAKVE
jgi:peptidyl-prolyl cis-trans isomerase C